jgi:hypothetical protein
MGQVDARARPAFARREKRLALSRSRTMFIRQPASNLVTTPIALPRFNSSEFLSYLRNRPAVTAR